MKLHPASSAIVLLIATGPYQGYRHSTYFWAGFWANSLRVGKRVRNVLSD